MRRVGVGVIVLAACGRIGFDETTGGGRTIRSTLTLDRAAIAEPLIDFPVVVTLDDTRARRDLMAPDASDLRFRDADGTRIAHEIEQLGERGGAPLVAWVRVPWIEGSATTITVEYGGSPAAATPLPVWNDSYLGVWHMNGAGTLVDATPNALHGTASGTTAAAGVVGGARSFDPTAADGVVVPGGASVRFVHATLSGWMNARAAPVGYFAAITRELGLTPDDDFYLGTVDLDMFGGVASQTTGIPFLYGPRLALSRWTHIAYTYDGSVARLFIDGRMTNEESGGGVPEASQGPIYIGCGRNNNGGTTPLDVPDVDFMNGLLDEIRLEQVGRSPAWITTEVASMRDALISYGPVEPL